MAPGLINAHHHLTGDPLVRSCIPDLLPPGASIFQWSVPLHGTHTPDDDELSATLSAVESLRYGTTTVVDYCHDIRSPAFAPASIAALKETGIRHLFTYSFMPVGPDEFAGPQDRLADGRRVYDQFHDPKGLTTIAFGVESIGEPVGLAHGVTDRRPVAPDERSAHRTSLDSRRSARIFPPVWQEGQYVTSCDS